MADKNSVRKEIFDRIEKTKEMKRRVLESRDFSLGDKSKWIGYYDGYIGMYRHYLSEYERGDKIKRLRSLLKKIFISLIVLGILLTGTFFLVLKQDVFFAPPIELYTQSLNFSAYENTTYVWSLENIGRLQSLSISGLIEGNGTVRVYLINNEDQWLILNSKSLEVSETRLLTGFAIEESNITINQTLNETNYTPSNETIEQVNETSNVTDDIIGVNESMSNITETVEVREFQFYCEETCDLSNFNLNQSSYELRIEISDIRLKIDEIAYGIIPEPMILPENITEPTNVTIPENITEIPEILKIERKIDKKGKIAKEVLVAASDGVLDTAIVSSEIEDVDIKIENKKNIKIYDVDKKKFVSFEINDSDDDGYIDSVEWTVDSLNETIQTFEVIIIIKAIHLDSNRIFISDIYEEVRELDDIWSETISDGHYVRVTFEKNLTNKNDITLWPRIVSGNPRIEIYEVDSSDIIAEFGSLRGDEYNKVYLRNLQNSQDVFDLRIFDGDIEIDHIIDPPGEQLENPSFTGNANYWTLDSGDSPFTYDSAEYQDTAGSIHSAASKAQEGNHFYAVQDDYDDYLDSDIVYVSCWYLVDALGTGAGQTYANLSIEYEEQSNPGVWYNLYVILDDDRLSYPWTWTGRQDVSLILGTGSYRIRIHHNPWSVSNNGYHNVNIDNCSLEIEFVNVAPTVDMVSVDSDDFVDLDPGVETEVEIIFNVTDYNGYSDINDSSVYINLTSEGEPVRDTFNCSTSTNDGLNTKTFNCTVNMSFYDKSGVWNASVYIEDIGGLSDIEPNYEFQVNLLRYISLSPAGITFPTVSPGGTNYRSLSNTTITNLGNFEIPGISVLNITSQALIGESDSTQNISGDNFRSADQNVVDVCSSGTPLDEDNPITVNTNIGRGPSSTRDIQHCLTSVPVGLSVQIYSAKDSNAWDISVVALMVAVIPTRRKKKKKLRKEELLQVLDENLEDIIGLVNERRVKGKIQGIKIPLAIFKEKISPAEALSKYLKENLNLKFSEMALALNRNQRTVWINYRNAVKKKKLRIKIKKKEMTVPVDIFGDRRLSVLESIVSYLKIKGIENSEIANLLGKSPSNVWTLNLRVEKKLIQD